MSKLFDFGSLLPGGKNESAEYKAGYDAAEKKYKKLETERDVAVNQLRRLGYELGESPDPIRNASAIKRFCRSHTSCDGCDFNSQSGCILNGESPSVWRIM